MKYKIGEIVKIRPDLKVGQIYHNENSPVGDTLTFDMRKNLGKEAEVIGYNEGKYLLKIEGKVALHQTYTDGMICNLNDEFTHNDYLFNPEVEKLMIHMETIRLKREIDEALDNGDRELFNKLTTEYNRKKEFLQGVM
jgi:IDEAL domain